MEKFVNLDEDFPALCSAEFSAPIFARVNLQRRRGALQQPGRGDVSPLLPARQRPLCLGISLTNVNLLKN
jgi:hypothetical protein